jgi:hypothetical protein
MENRESENGKKTEQKTGKSPTARAGRPIAANPRF